MKPEEKAKELIEKYADSLPSIFYNVVEAKNYHSAKRCALIAVAEIIKEYNTFFQSNYNKSYWEVVKQEIERV